MTLKTLMAAAGVLILSATASIAVTVTVGGDDFDVTTISGSFDANQDLLESQIWFGDASLAAQFAEAVGDTFGFPNFGGSGGPLFVTLVIAADADLGEEIGAQGLFDSNGTPTGQSFFVDPDIDAIFAIASPVAAVPLPAGGLLLLSGLGAVAALKRRKKRAA